MIFTSISKIILLLQRDLHMAISWWMATGTNKKMESDIHSLEGGVNWKKAFFTPKIIRQNVPIGINQTLSAFIILGSGITLSAFILFLELFRKICMLSDNKNNTNLKDMTTRQWSHSEVKQHHHRPQLDTII